MATRSRYSSRARRRRGKGGAAGFVAMLLGVVLLGFAFGALITGDLGLQAFARTPENVRVIDGDTLAMRESNERIRLVNIDTAEIGDHARCAAERAHGEAAKAEVRTLISNARSIDVRRISRRDMYGRTLAYVRLDGADLGETLMAQGLARPWRGHRQPWCGPGGALIQ